MLTYAKAHACGNDFLIVEAAIRLPEEAERALAIALCARTTGVGADGIEFFSWTGERSGTIRLRNADGSLAEISGNGTRCVAAWMAWTKHAEPGESFTLETDAGPRTCLLQARDNAGMLLRTGMGVPQVQRANIALDEDAMLIEGAIVSTGNPHFVVRVDDGSFEVAGPNGNLDWQTVGRALSVHPRFPAQTNVEFVHVLSPDRIAIRIFERGVGSTTSSGTGTCAGAAAAMLLHGSSRTLAVEAPGGTQTVTWPSNTAEMELTGPAELICTGKAFVHGFDAEALA